MGEKTEMRTGFPWGNLRERDYFKYLRAGQRIVLKQM
jgi:hypothetical protein